MGTVKKAVKAAQDKVSSILGTFTGKCCDSNVFNNNDWRASRPVFEKLQASDEYKRAMENGHYVGFLGHPEDMDCQDDKNACIVMKDMRILDNGEIEGDFDLVNTPVGQIVKAMMDAGVKYGLSIRGLGDIGADGELDPDDFIFRGFDLVRFPAYDDCIPEFKAIAASTDTKKKANYQKIKASIDNNLKQITSCEALSLIQEQLTRGSEEYNQVQERIDELTTDADVIVEVEPVAEQVMDEKLEAMTQLYLDAADSVRELEQQLVESQLANDDLKIECQTIKHKYSRLSKLASTQIEAANSTVDELENAKERNDARFKKIKASLATTRNELKEVRQELADTQDAYDKQVTANTRLRDRIDALNEQRKDDREAIKASENLNLKYMRKIEANSEAVSQKDSAIEELKSQLNETVIACKELESKASNLDEKNGELLSRVEAAEEMVTSYQQAYANMYANALGVYLPSLPISASTSVEELTNMIKAGTSTAGIPSSASMYASSEEDDYDDYLDDDDQYSAEMVTL